MEGNKHNRFYISFEEARKIIKENVFALDVVEVDVKLSTGYVLAEDIRSPIHLPPFSSSAMDGYAVGGRGKFFKLVGEIKTGSTRSFRIKKDEAIKVFTGSHVPQGTYAVIMKEVVEESGENGVIHVRRKFRKNENIRFAGEEVKKGDVVLRRGKVITPGVVGFLSSMGYKTVKVIRKPSVACIITGSEIVEPGKPLKNGQVYDSNSFSLYSALKLTGIERIFTKRVKDNPKLIKKVFRSLLGKSDVVIFSGGISVGDYDFVRDILMESERISPFFYKVKQKPGKPIFVGNYQEGTESRPKIVFALPGNPASVLTCFWEYVFPFLRGMMGYKDIFLPETEKILTREIRRGGGGRRLHLIRALVEGESVTPLPNQESHMLSSFALANALVIMPENKDVLRKGEKVKVHLIPPFF